MGSVYATNFANTAVMYMVPIFIFLHVVSFYTGILFMALGFGVIMFFNLITLPVEFDASARAKVVLQQLGIVQPGREAQAVNSTLNAAGLTYIAAFLGTLLQFLYYLMLLTGNNRRN
jgi:Zn-dependent membrane protease YugP